MSARPSIAIVGGGIAGLAAAWELTRILKESGADVRVELIEAEDRCGGPLASAEFAGRVVDTGPDGFLARRPEVVQLVTELGWSERLEPIAASGAHLFLGGRIRPLPEGMVLGLPTSRDQLRALGGLSRRALRAAWRDEVLPRRLEVGEDASIGQIARAKLGDEIALRVVEPMIGGIQAGRIDELSAQSVFPALLQAARAGGSLMKAVRAIGAATPGPPAGTVPGPMFCSLTSSVGSLPGELVRQLVERGVVVSTSTRVTALRRTPSSFYPWEVDTATTTTPANALVVATPPQPAGRLLGALDPALAALGSVRSASAAMVTFCLSAAETRLPERGTGVLVPLGTPSSFGDSMMVTAITLLDRKWPHLAREGEVLLRAHVGRIDDERSATMSDEQLTSRVAAELADLLGGLPSPRSTMVARWPGQLPQYEVGHAARVEAARVAARAHGVALAGNAYDGVGIPASVGSGRRAAREVVAMLPG